MSRFSEVRRFDFRVIRGDTRTLRIRIFNRDNQNNTYDLAGKTVFFSVKYRDFDPDSMAVIYKIIYPPGGNILEVRLNTNDTFNLQPNVTYYYDVRIRDGSNVFTVLRGRIQVIQPITHTP